MSNIQASHLKLRFSATTVPCLEQVEVENVIRQQRIDILAWDKVKGDDVSVGYMMIGILDSTLATNERLSLMAAADAHSSQYWELADVLLDRYGRYRQSVHTAIGFEAFGAEGILYIEALYIKQKYRGQKLGLAALHSLMRYGAMGCESIFLKAHPFCDEGIADANEVKRACQGLRAYYSKLGFNRIGRSTFMGTCLKLQLPPNPALVD